MSSQLNLSLLFLFSILFPHKFTLFPYTTLFRSDFIATDHAPHGEEEKAQGFLEAPFGISGLETAFSLLYTHLVKTNKKIGRATSELQSRGHLVCRLLLEKKKKIN